MRQKLIYSAAIVLLWTWPLSAWAQMGIPYVAEDEAVEADVGDAEVDEDQNTESKDGGSSPESAPEPGDTAKDEDDQKDVEDVAPPEPKKLDYGIRADTAAQSLRVWMAARENKRDDSTQMLSALVTKIRRAGWPGASALSALLCAEAKKSQMAGRLVDAEDLYVAAVELSPKETLNVSALGDLYWEMSRPLDAIKTWGTAIFADAAQPEGRRALGVVLAGALTLSCFGFLIVLCGFKLVFSTRLVAFDLCRLMHISTGNLGGALLLGLLLTAPLLMGLGWLWIVLLWLLIFAAHYRRAERVLVILSLGVLGASVFALPVLLEWNHERSSQAGRDARFSWDMHAAKPSSFSDTGARESEILGRRMLWSGDYRGAEKALKNAVDAGGTSSELLAATGTAFLAQGHFDKASEYFDRALRRDKKNISAYINLSQSYFAQTEPQEADAVLRRGQKAVGDALALETRRLEALGADVAFSFPKEPKAGSLAITTESVRAAGQILHQWIPRGNARGFALGSAIGIVFLLVIGLASSRLMPATHCERCGAPASVGNSPEMPDQKQCGPCYYALVKRSEEVEASMRVKKEIESHRYEAVRGRWRRTFALLLPGGAWLYDGAVLRAWFVFMTVVMFVAIGALSLAGDTWVFDSRAVASPLVTWASFGIAALVYGVSAFYTLFRAK